MLAYSLVNCTLAIGSLLLVAVTLRDFPIHQSTHSACSNQLAHIHPSCPPWALDHHRSCSSYIALLATAHPLLRTARRAAMCSQALPRQFQIDPYHLSSELNRPPSPARQCADLRDKMMPRLGLRGRLVVGVSSLLTQSRLWGWTSKDAFMTYWNHARLSVVPNALQRSNLDWCAYMRAISRPADCTELFTDTSEDPEGSVIAYWPFDRKAQVPYLWGGDVCIAQNTAGPRRSEWLACVCGSDIARDVRTMRRCLSGFRARTRCLQVSAYVGRGNRRLSWTFHCQTVIRRWFSAIVTPCWGRPCF